MTRLRRWLSDPLPQFLLLGALLLGVQALWPRTPGATAATRIVVPAAQRLELEQRFREASGRLPDATELNALAQRWIDDEVLVREALALRLHESDPIVRRELQQKLRFLLEDTHPIDEPTEADLQQWLDQHADRYGEPARMSFEQVFISRAQPAGISVEQRLEVLNVALLHDAPDLDALSDPLPGGTRWLRQSQADLQRHFGAAFAKVVSQQPIGAWSTPITSALGLHRVRVIERQPWRPASLDTVRRQVLIDCRQARREQANRRALDALRARYDVVYQAGDAS